MSSAKQLLRNVSTASPLKLQHKQMSLWLGKSCVLQEWLFASCQKRRSPLTTFKHILARTLVAAARGTLILRWIFNKEGFVTNLNKLPPDAQSPEPQRHYEVARSPRRAHPSPTTTHATKMPLWLRKLRVLQNNFEGTCPPRRRSNYNRNKCR